MQKLFVSFTALLRNLKHGTISQDDLDRGLYYFGCVRMHAMEPWIAGKKDGIYNELTWFFKDKDGKFDADAAAIAHRRLIAALEKAEAEGRVEWCVHGEYNTYGQLNVLLVRNGFTSVAEEDCRIMNGSYCYPGVEDRVREAGLDLVVVQ